MLFVAATAAAAAAVVAAAAKPGPFAEAATRPRHAECIRRARARCRGCGWPQVLIYFIMLLLHTLYVNALRSAGVCLMVI